MDDSYVFNLSDTEKSMKSFKRYGRPYPLEYLDVVYGDKNIYSTVHDLLKWDLALRRAVLFKNPRSTAPMLLIVSKNPANEIMDSAGE